MKHILFLLLLAMTCHVSAADKTPGVAVRYSLPATGELPKTWRVTLAVTDPNSPERLLSTFVAGEAVTVTAENRGQFTAVWDGLDDNFMPLPPGEYGLRGIFMPAEKWDVDGEHHTLIPEYITAATAFRPKRGEGTKRLPFSGDPCHSPLRDICATADGKLAFGYGYLENGTSNPLADITGEIGREQVLAAFNSGGAGSTEWIATDGIHVWAQCPGDGGVPFIFRTDGAVWGTENAKFRRNVFVQPEGKTLAGLAARRAADASGEEKTTVYVALNADDGGAAEVIALAGENGERLKERWAFPEKIVALTVGEDGGLYVLTEENAGARKVKDYAVLALNENGRFHGRYTWASMEPPTDLAVDRAGNVYVMEPENGVVIKFSADGPPRPIIGVKERPQSPEFLKNSRTGTYDKNWLLYPERVTTWTDENGETRVLTLESHGPNRVAEWSADGKLLREWLTLQTWANDGYDADPADPTRIYIPGHGGYLTRFRVDYETGEWTVEAVWPGVMEEEFQKAQKPRVIHANGQKYVVFEKNFAVYRFTGGRCMPSAAIFRSRVDNRQTLELWRDENGDGRVQDTEKRTLENPARDGWIFRYHGDRVLDDMSLICMEQEGDKVWRLPVARFDAHGNPVYAEKFELLLTDPVFAAMKAGTAVDALHGGNECATKYNSDWAMTDGSMADGFYVLARGGKNFTANFGAQVKLARYVPDEKGGYRMTWRVGRTALQGTARPGEMYGPMYVWENLGLVAVVDQSRMGLVVYTADGFYVDTIFTDDHRFRKEQVGMYSQPGEFFAGRITRRDGQIYALVGKYTPEIFKLRGWDTDFVKRVKPVTFPQKTVTLTAGETASPPEIALKIRGGAGTAKVARFQPATGGAPALDGSVAEWLACEPVIFRASENQAVEVRGMVDAENLYLNWNVRLGERRVKPVSAKSLERVFTHDREADTLSFYLQTDAAAKAATDPAGRRGDVRFVFTLTQDEDENGGEITPRVLGMYASAPPFTDASPLTYGSPVGTAKFAHVGEVPSVRMGYTLHEDGHGFSLAAAIPLKSLPLPVSLTGGTRLLGNFDATFGGKLRFWWANMDGSASTETHDEPSEARLYPGSWAMLQFQELADSLTVRTWQVAGPWMTEANKDFRDGNDEMKRAIQAYFENFPTPQDAANYAFWGDFSEKSGVPPWQLRSVEGTDPWLNLGQAGRLYHQMVWIHSPEETRVKLVFYANPMNVIRVAVEDEKRTDRQETTFRHTPDEDRHTEVTLRPGWNRVLLRSYAYGYSLRVGMSIHAAAETLWKLKVKSE